MKKNITFNDLGLSGKILSAVNKKGFEEPTEIQALTIPLMLKNDSNIIAQAQTGTGKTAAFGLPLIEMIRADIKDVQALILVPTRELAIQVSEEISSLKGEKDIKTVPIYGGQSIDQQLRRLKKGVHIVVGSPGRVIDHLKRRTLKLDKIEHLILDEADEMLNMGFIDDMEEIFEYTNPDKKTLLFSATMPNRIKSLAKKYMDGYELLTAKKVQLTTDLTEQIYFEVRVADKFGALCRIIDIEDNFYGLVFCRTKINVDKIATHLADRGYDSEAIHGDISQPQRERTLNKFKSKKINILVATDVAARGIDVNDLTHVINYSLPQDPEAYVHRIGRTGRAGKEGTAITFITPNEYSRLMFIQRKAGSDIKKSAIPGVEDIINAKRKKIDENLASINKETIHADYYNWAKELLGENNHTEILAAVLNYSFEESLNPKSYGDIADLNTKRKNLDQQGKTRLFVAMGKKDKINAKKLVDLVLSKVSMKAKDISDIQIMDSFSFMTVPFEMAEKIVVSFKKKRGRPLISHVKKSKKKKRKKKR
ncbi:MAG: DEAD/DEAH box helicase [Candidatus Marinimicrobia bacterium]|jgi:ATP-dependent RNA helicase DeaD|nr:DEAD/DEAH box helicase [Candidatus Neomarinimicrobiota bacterium]MBT3618336.1 DEAD/DEAH box helicase [Candidatus Neomarinimicrobiota bacterium]MBT3829131.1 DEAD/DEAH box helicase [Candidatus Neomarinimicrobiota bacterium]MBT3998099.1 DEAD/DEAH box helicase [Candidatus Neomarinimicrobiota bacterium]MBT4281440.1 DEAD/DEAH box helicase [Candidatus Neomarinimicrobiota bacterium]